MNHYPRSYLPLLFITTLVPAPLLASDIKPADESAVRCGFASSIQFIESAPRDIFRLNNSSSMPWNIQRAAIDLSTSAGNLIFDITAEGAGVEVFQPFKNEVSTATLVQQPEVGDGDQIIILAFEQFTSANDFTFSIDVDDQLRDSELGQIRVSGSEIQGASITLNISNSDGGVYELSGIFNPSNQVDLKFAGC